jgi:threonine/homoserine/homoserine lactone efflux protein
MDLWVLFGVGFGTALSGMMIPGPLFLYTVSEALRHGHRTGVKIAGGHLLLEAGFVGLVMLGLRAFLGSAAVRIVVSLVGGCGLIIMGLLVLWKVRSLSLAQQSSVECRFGPWLGGALFSLVSPGFLLWWATIGASVLLQGALAGVAGVAMVLAGHALADVGWCWCIASSVSRGRRYCTDGPYRAVMACLAVGLLALGLSYLLAARGI